MTMIPNPVVLRTAAAQRQADVLALVERERRGRRAAEATRPEPPWAGPVIVGAVGGVAALLLTMFR
jgi:hypothetical protein